MAKRVVRTRSSWLQFLSFVAVMLLGLSLAISKAFTFFETEFFNNLANWIRNIAIAIALIVPLWYSYYEARKQKQVWFILWIVAVILIVVFYFWGLNIFRF